MDRFCTPPPAEPGSSVAVIAPSGGAAQAASHILELALDRLETIFDLDPVVFPTARQSDGFLRENSRARAAAIHEAFADPEIDAIFATIGGDDQIRVLDYLDPELLAEHPTRFFGMSDNTNLALFLWNQGIVSFYGGQLLNQVATPDLHPYSERSLRRALFEDSVGELDAAGEWTDLTVGWHRSKAEYVDADLDYEPLGWRWRGGTEPVSGRLWGGCLSIVAWQLMTDRYLPAPDQLDGAILALETSEELPGADRVRRVLTCLGERGLLTRFDGVLVGRPATQNWRESRTEDEREQYRASQRETITEQVRRYNPAAPVVFDLDFGHTDPTAPIPIGGRVRIEPEERIVFE
jgi:muramoyltetrapeptide carboxypeptidase LdcA involved in peptidoglycan recycling